MKEKKCGRCQEIKDESNFGFDKRTPTGLRSTCNECRRLESKEYRQKYPSRRKQILQVYYQKNKEKELERFKNYRINNPEKRKETCKNYVERNKEKHNKYSREWKRKKMKSDPLYKIIHNLRIRTKGYLKKARSKKNYKFLDIIGCSSDQLKEHLENKFTEGMSWDNYGFYGWHIDHIIPLSSAKSKDEIYKLCHYTNLQPLWCKENLSKGDKIII